MILKATKAILLATMFNVLIYFVHSSIGSLGKVDLISGDFKKSTEKKLVQYRRALKESELELEASKNVEIRKCCKDSYVFNEACRCILDKTREKLNFFPHSMIIDENFVQVSSNISVNIVILDTKSQCKDQAILLKDGDPMNYFIMQKTGDLVQLDSFKVIFNYSRYYCLDVVHNKNQRYFALMLCPCEEHVCIQKCCPVGQYYNTVTNTCAKSLQEHKQWKLDFYKKKDKVNDTVNQFLFNRPLNCSGNTDQLINSLSEPRDVLVQENGKLWRIMDNGTFFTDPISYCVDMFSDGKNNSTSHINGFICNMTQNKRMVREKSYPVNKCCREGESLNKKFKCQRTPENVSNTQPPKFMADAVSRMEYANFDFSSPTGYLSIKLTTNDYYTEQSYKGQKVKVTIKDILKNYHYSMFCIDEYHHGSQSDFGIIFAPCKTEPCLQKCCPPDHFYDIKENGCRKDSVVSGKNIEVYKYKGFRQVGRAADYFLIYSSSKTDCRSFGNRLYNYVGYTKLQIQENGDISKRKGDNYMWTHPSRYCVDIFSDGEVSLANGFYCDKRSDKKRRILHFGPWGGHERIYPYRTMTSGTDTATKPYKSILLLWLIQLLYLINF